MKFYTNVSEATELSLEKQFLVKKYETITLPSLTRNMVAFEALKYAGLMFDNRKAFNDFHGIPAGHCEAKWAVAEFDWYCNLASREDFSEGELRVVALNAYFEFMRSQQIVETLVK